MINNLEILGKWEYVTIPGFVNKRFKARCDTGANYSSLHAYDLDIFELKKKKYVNFKLQENGDQYTLLVDSMTIIKSSNGEVENRPIVYIPIQIANRIVAVECTLTNRESMKYRMLIGRKALENRFIVDPGRWNLHGKIRRKK